MTKETPQKKLHIVYQNYLADIIAEFEALEAHRIIPKGVSLIRRDNDMPVILSLPPIPPIFESLDAEAIEEIRGAVQNYFHFLQPLEQKEIIKRAHKIYFAALQTLELKKVRGWNTSENIDDYLTTTTLVYKNIAQKEDAHLDYFILALMRMGILLKKIKSSAAADINAELEHINRIFRSAYEKYAVFQGIQRTHRNEDYKSRIKGAEGGNQKDKEYYEPCRKYAFRFYKKICKCPQYKYNKTIARDIHPRLMKMVKAGIFKKCPTEGVFLKEWIREFKKLFPPTR